MKTENQPKPQRRRQIFVLTTEEKKTIVFILCAFILGLTVKHYRDAHPVPPRPLSAKEQRAVKKTAHLHGKPPAISPSPATK